MRPSIFQPRRSPHALRGVLTTEALTPAHHKQVIDLIRAGHSQHLHLDWHTLPDLLASPGFRGWVLTEGGAVRAVLAATIHLDAQINTVSSRQTSPGAAWLRIAVIDESYSTADDLDTLWEAAQGELRRSSIAQIYLLLMDGWIRRPAQRWGFRRNNAVVTLRRSAQFPLPIPQTHGRLRIAGQADLDEIARIDRLAFGPLWQYSRETLAEAARHAATCTVIESNTAGIVGYQLSTYHMNAGHLARLAVDPAYQGRGYGYALTAGMLDFFHRRRTTTVTVNTQEDNYASQRLYERLGFRRTGYDVPLLAINL